MTLATSLGPVVAETVACEGLDTTRCVAIQTLMTLEFRWLESGPVL